MKLNISKTNYIFFQNRSLKNTIPPIKLEGEILKQMNHTKFLGVLIDENLNWKLHIDEICFKVAKTCGIMYKIRYNLTTEALISIYYTLCYPYLTYCVPIWASTWPSFLKKVIITQNKIVRCISFSGKYDSVTEIMSSMNILKFDLIYKYFSLLLIYKMSVHHIGNDIFNFVSNVHLTRSNDIDLCCPQFRTALFKNSILCSGPKLFNGLPLNKKTMLKSHNYLSFKREIKKYLHQQS